MKYQGCLLAVSDISISKKFYEEVLHQNVMMDMGVHVTFEGFSLQQGYAELIGVENDTVTEQSHNFPVSYTHLDVYKRQILILR